MTHPSETPRTSQAGHHRGPHPGALAIVYMVLFLAGLSFVVSFTSPGHFPGPSAAADTMVAYFQAQSRAVLMCAFLQFGSAIPLGIFTACIASRLQYLGVRAAGPSIAMFGGFLTAFDILSNSHILWAMTYPGIAQDPALLRALYFLSFGFGGPGFSVPMGLLIAGISVSAGFAKLLPRWLVVVGLLLAACGELSWVNMVVPQALFVIPLTRFPGFLWLIAVGFMLPSTAKRRLEPQVGGQAERALA
jgi:hypothetical protein